RCARIGRALRVTKKKEGVSLCQQRVAQRHGAVRRFVRLQWYSARMDARCADSCGAMRTFMCSSRALRRVLGAWRQH
ncbi:hypothetical protein A2U01_0071061, partial [Trifolium medium]|nr:hypothetical protein [Trifolium medium]